VTDRASLLAALADPQRLRIVDALAEGDRAPTELSEALELPSNLLAHHLGVLTEAGVIRRRRSDGDGRRSYLALNWDEPIVAATIGSGEAFGACRVVFVCTANSARSQFAAALFARQSDVPVASAGTQPADAINPRALAELERRGLEPLTPHPVSLAFERRMDDLVVAVCDNAYEADGTLASVHWSVPDPAAADTDEAFAAAFDQIQPRVRRLAAAVTNGDPS